MPNTTKMGWPYPAENQDPWFDPFKSFVDAADAAAYAAREDRNMFLLGGGVITFTASSGSLAWSSSLFVFSPISGLLETIVAGALVLADGQSAYVNVVRSPVTAPTLTVLAASQLPSTDQALIIAVRRGTQVVLRNGVVVADGTSESVKKFVLTDAASVVVDASLGEFATLTAAGNRTMNIPTGSPFVDGQPLEIRHRQDGTGTRNPTWTGGVGGYRAGTGLAFPSLAARTAGQVDHFMFRYNLTDNKWDFLDFQGAFG